MQFPLSFQEISLVLAVVALTLLITSQLMSLYIGQRNLAIEKKVLRRTALLFGFAFLFTCMIIVFQMISAA